MGLKQKKYLSSENIGDKLQQMNSEMKNNIRSEMKEIKERLDTLTASLEVDRDEGQLWQSFESVMGHFRVDSPLCQMETVL